MRKRLQRFQAAAGLSLALTAACGGAVTPNGPPPPPPCQSLSVSGTADQAAATFGPEGGSLGLERGPTFVVPRDMSSHDAVTVTLRREPVTAPPSGVLVSDTYLQTPGMQPRGQARYRFFIPVSRITGQCSEQDLKLAYERPGDVGPADGTSSPALSWAYETARRSGDTLSAELTHSFGMHLVFVCVQGSES